jgi:hypothetical membrane protein
MGGLAGDPPADPNLEAPAMTLERTLTSTRGRTGATRLAVVSNDLRLAGGALLALGTAFITVTMLAASIAPSYDFNAAAISDLGTIPETAILFNGLLIVVGLLNAVAGYFLYRAFGSPWTVVLFALAGLGALGAGVVPLSAGDAHSLFAVLAFLFFNVEALAVARVLRGAMRWLAVGAGALGLVYLGVMVIGDGGNPAVFGAIGHGGSERMIAYPVMLLMIALGGHLLALAGPGLPGPRRAE